MERRAHAKLVLVFQKLGLAFPSKRGYKFTIAWMLSVPYSTMITPSDVPYYSNSDSDALCLVLDAHRCSAVNVKSYVPYFPSGRSALFVVRDAHRYSVVVVESYAPYSPSGRNALGVVRDVHRYSAVVVESYVPYSPSGRNALCVVLDANRYSAVVVESYACPTLLQACV